MDRWTGGQTVARSHRERPLGRVAISRLRTITAGLLRRFAPRNDYLKLPYRLTALPPSSTGNRARVVSTRTRIRAVSVGSRWPVVSQMSVLGSPAAA
jgi:hypothetical protein